MPVPDDLVPLLNNDRQRLITAPQEKATAQLNAADDAAHQRSSTAVSKEAASTAAPSTAAAPAAPSTSVSTAANKYKLAPIPQWDPQRAAAAKAALAEKLSAVPAKAAELQQASTDAAASQSKASRFNVSAKEFVFRPGAAAFTPTFAAPAPPVAAAQIPAPITPQPETQAAAPAVAQPPVAVNPFFGLDAPRPVKIYPGRPVVPFTVKEDFAPSRAGGMPDPSSVRK